MFFNVYVIIEILNVVCVATDLGDDDTKTWLVVITMMMMVMMRRPYQGHQHSTFCLSCQIILCPGSKNKRDEMIVQECLFLFSKNKCHDVKVFVGLYN